VERLDGADDRIEQLEAENEALRERLALVEERLAERDADGDRADDPDQNSQPTDAERTTDNDTQQTTETDQRRSEQW
jgi:hypothetical protein